MSRLPPHSPWPSRLVVTSRSGATPIVPMNGVIGQLMRSLKWSVPSRVVPLGPGRVAEDLGRVAPRELGVAGGLAERAAARADRDPGVALDQDVLDGHDERVAPLGALEPHRAADRVREGRDAVEPGPPRGDGEVLRRPEVPRARVVGLDLEALAGLHPEERLVPPVERVLPGLLTRDPLHGLGVPLAPASEQRCSGSRASPNRARSRHAHKRLARGRSGPDSSVTHLWYTSVMPAKNPRVNVVLERPLYEALGRLARREGTSLSLKVRDLLREALEAHEDLVLGQVAQERRAAIARPKPVPRPGLADLGASKRR